MDMPRESTAFPCSVDVLSVDHKEKAKGTYFNFDKKQLDAILGTTSWSGDKLKASNGRLRLVVSNGRFWVSRQFGEEVVVWREANGGSKGDAHGRWDVDPKAGQFQVGQKVTFTDCTAAKLCTLQVLSTHGPEGGEGKYFNFDKSALDAILGRSDWDNEELEVGSGKTVQVWRTKKGSKGDAHGRYDPFDSTE